MIWSSTTGSATAVLDDVIVIPKVGGGTERAITTRDMASLRRIENLSVSPDRTRAAFFVRQGEAASNVYRGEWFVASMIDGSITPVADGGELQLTPDEDGGIEVPTARWSPDGKWIAYTRRQRGAAQLWRSSTDGRTRQQLSNNSADVVDFYWSEDSLSIYYGAGISRADLQTHADRLNRQGYSYDEDLGEFTQFMLPRYRVGLPDGDVHSIWRVSLAARRETPGTQREREWFERASAGTVQGVATIESAIQDERVAPVARPDGSVAWLERSKPHSLHLHVVASLVSAGGGTVRCQAQECLGRIKRVWWSQDGSHVLFWRNDGIGSGPYGGKGGRGFYSWSPQSGAVTTILYSLDDHWSDCDQIAGNRLLCVRDTPTRPQHLATIDLESGAIKEIVDVNPEFKTIKLGRVERFEWDTPKFAWNEQGGRLAGLYPTRAYGYILYPPNFDPARKYPVVIEPYVAYGFESSTELEHPLHVYAANGFIVLNTAFPSEGENPQALLGDAVMDEVYSASLDFPHMSMYMESTVRALDAVAARGFVDETKVGIGGVSHGTFIPLYMLQKHDRIAAISISGPAWGAHTYYWLTAKMRGPMTSWNPDPDSPEGARFWRAIDPADHIDAIEAPVLINSSAAETYGLVRFIRRLADGGRPYDAYVFPDETHIKWQPAHLYAIQNRNLDWFRFWLQGYEDPDPAKEEQYRRWHRLRLQQQALTSGGKDQ